MIEDDRHKRSISDGNALLFLGAGAATICTNSSNENIPLTKKLAEILSEAISPGSRPAEIQRVAGSFVSRGKSAELIQIITEQLKICNCPEAYNAILGRSWLRIITTNYDIGRQHEERRACVRGTGSPPAKEFFTNRDNVIYLNGQLRVLLPENIDEQLRLTSNSYNKNPLSNEWCRLLHDDINRAEAIFFVGYSLFDIDIARLISDASLSKRKTYFIEYSEINEFDREELERYGTVISCNADAFGTFIASLPEASGRQYDDNFVSILRYKQPVSPIQRYSPNDFFNAVIYGQTKPEDFSWGRDNTPRLYVRRDVAKRIEGELSTENCFVVHGDVACGKSWFLNEFANSVSKGEWRMFSVKNEKYLDAELKEVLKSEPDLQKTVLLVDNFMRYREHFGKFGEFVAAGGKMVLLDNSISIIGNEADLERQICENILYNDINFLSPAEISELEELIGNAILWGDAVRGRRSADSRRRRLIEEFRSHLPSIYLFLVKSEVVRAKINDQYEEDLRTFDPIQLAGVLVLLALDQEVVWGDIRESLKLSEGHRNHISPFYSIDSGGKLDSRSSSFARVLLSQICDHKSVAEAMLRLVQWGNSIAEYDEYGRTLVRQLMQRSTIERYFPAEPSEHTASNYDRNRIILAYYEQIGVIDEVRKNPHYHLQYGISIRLVGDLERAKGVLKSALNMAKVDSRVEKLIQNHLARVDLDLAIATENSVAAFSLSKAALEVISLQMSDALTVHYPFKAGGQLKRIFEVHYERWDVRIQDVFLRIVKNLHDKAQRIMTRTAVRLRQERGRGENQPLINTHGSIKSFVSDAAEILQIVETQKERAKKNK